MAVKVMESIHISVAPDFKRKVAELARTRQTTITDIIIQAIENETKEPSARLRKAMKEVESDDLENFDSFESFMAAVEKL